eukprot:TRINITY_DN105361_c0_g1_i1.p1 TRINITY_DN105361_c0_g1~~TRINITY_DN105361_c0_g1_i1.p1  ORF type:complete len:313 (-),score=0.77 TRINITY_DN105361_c0_g1_i1:12-950(-)
MRLRDVRQLPTSEQLAEYSPEAIERYMQSLHIDQFGETVSENCYCGSPGLLKCSGCHSTRYCGKEHQVSDWKKHKKSCPRLKRDYNDEQWRNTTDQTLHMPPATTIDGTKVTDWKSYHAASGCTDNFDSPTFRHLTIRLTDGLTVFTALRTFDLDPQRMDSLCVDVLGSRNAFEVDAYSLVLKRLLPSTCNLTVRFFGPELDPTMKTAATPSWVQLHKGLYHELAAASSVLPAMAAVFTPGPEDSWIPTFKHLLDKKIPVMIATFDQEDLEGCTFPMLEPLAPKVVKYERNPVGSLVTAAPRNSWILLIRGD